ncbi:5-(carboxyamino)imidazole ribonucleotide synthase [Longimonas halophila]|uniref:N5-carboxyaminoimidazole ribonucleotide synthase n=1 Tax=Longimonas halophila TaxID=1469170 RepID=A0A2H3NLB8_9BACT|nr:5-(carboxyamino)imidazole ribonucleotide synthase [Longimonas halophila]
MLSHSPDFVVTSFPTLGILGGGQLGKMMAAEAVRLGMGVRLLAPKDAGPMQAYAHATTADWTDPDILRDFATGCTAVTVESEWAPADVLAPVCPEDTALWPSPQTLGWIRHKGVQNDRLAAHDLPLPSYRCCATPDEVRAAGEALGWPLMLKQYEGSYDGYGNRLVERPDEVDEAWNDLAADDGVLAEQCIDFVRELAVQIARRPNGTSVAYPVVHTEQRDHRCHAVVAPAPMADDLAEEAQAIARDAIDAVEGVGLLAVELFETRDGAILVNEIAPRPHNTGHYTIEGCVTSQFENHVRAVLDLPLGATDLVAPYAVMVNVLGQREGTPPRADGWKQALQVPGAHVHIYGKPDVRPHRKMGHVTALGDTATETRTRAEEAAEQIIL